MSFPRPFHSLRPHPWHGLEPGPDPPRVGALSPGTARGDGAPPTIAVERTYDREHAYRVIAAAIADYDEEAGRPEARP
ncbi:MAG TPA: hypothetical protein VF121_10435 [Thermoanaerobaculia bacterium]|nr:hypothetical protein [Thermoanaerobaculia bacterium]